jgi:ribosomal protein L28
MQTAKRTRILKKIQAEWICFMCGKKAAIAQHRSHSMRAIKRVQKPNLQKYQGKYICTRCLRTLGKSS